MRASSLKRETSELVDQQQLWFAVKQQAIRQLALRFRLREGADERRRAGEEDAVDLYGTAVVLEEFGSVMPRGGVRTAASSRGVTSLWMAVRSKCGTWPSAAGCSRPDFEPDAQMLSNARYALVATDSASLVMRSAIAASVNGFAMTSGGGAQHGSGIGERWT